MSSERHDDDRDPAENYLWDRSGDPDPVVARLEQTLAPLRSRGTLPLEALAEQSSERAPARVAPVPHRPRRIAVLVAAPALTLALAAAVTAFVWTRAHDVEPIALRPDSPIADPSATTQASQPPPACGATGTIAGLPFASTGGAPRCDGAPATATGVLPQGTWLETDDARVRLDVANLGRVDVDRRSRLRVVETGEAGHRLELAHGRLEATIDAPPRLFFVSTKAATAVDLGCAYELTVDDQGAGVLRVKTGYVELEPVTQVWGVETSRLASLVPAGAECAIDPSRGPGIPVWSDAETAARAAVHRLEADPADGAALDTLLERKDANDTLVLVHLIERVPDARRVDVLRRLEALAPAPRGAPRDKMLARDPSALGAWREALARQWLARGK